MTDRLSGRIWLQDSACLGLADWSTANDPSGPVGTLAGGQCGLTDESVAGQWRLPTREEWSVAIQAGVTLGCTAAAGDPPSLTNNAGTACFKTGGEGTGPLNHAFSDLHPNPRFWSSTESDNPNNAYWASLRDGVVLDNRVKTVEFGMWPLRRSP